MTRHFLVLELLDPAVNAFLWSVRGRLGRPGSGAVHITIRGPYDSETPPRGALTAARRALKHDVVQIAGVGRFSNPEEEVVYLHVNSPNLRKVWWKPDYPIEQYGFTPHISVYRGSDPTLASLIARELTGAKVSLFCAEHQLVWYRSRQPNMLSSREPTVGDMEGIEYLSGADITLLDRLSNLLYRYHNARA